MGLILILQDVNFWIALLSPFLVLAASLGIRCFKVISLDDRAKRDDYKLPDYLFQGTFWFCFCCACFVNGSIVAFHIYSGAKLTMFLTLHIGMASCYAIFKIIEKIDISRKKEVG